MALGTLDCVLLIASVVASALIGVYFTNKNKSMEAYMLGDKKMTVFPVAVSLMTSCLSGLTLLGASAEFFYQGPTYVFVALPMLLSGPITAYTMLPVFYKMNTLSLYKYLFKRYGLTIKYIVTIVFMLQMIFYNSVVLYLPSMALGSTLGVPRVYSILLLGGICVAYSGFGGVKAVVWSDLFQAVLMFAALFVVAALGTYDAGGVQQVLELAAENGRLELGDFLSMDITTRHTLLGIMLGSTLKHIYIVGVNQIQIQRALSLPTLRQGQLSFCFCSFVAALVIILASYLGAVLVAAYRSCDPYLAGEIPRRDAILVHYVAHRLAAVPGMRGIFVAGIFSATLSTLSSFSNSMAALALEDFVKPAMLRMKHKQLSDSASTWLAKLLACVFGLACVTTAFLIDKANSRLLQTSSTLLGAIGVPFLTSFALGIFTRFVNTTGILTGFVVTLTLGLYVTIYQTFLGPPLMPAMPVYYSDQCGLVFNMTAPSSSLPSLGRELAIEWTETAYLPPVHTAFSVDKISYMMLPVVQFVLMTIVSTVVSLISGGWHQEVANKYLISFMQDPDSASKSEERENRNDSSEALPSSNEADTTNYVRNLRSHAGNGEPAKLGTIKL